MTARENWPHPEPFAIIDGRCAVCGYDYEFKPFNPTPHKDLALVDDLANVLMHMVVGWKDIIGHDLAQHPEVERVMARYRAAALADA